LRERREAKFRGRQPGTSQPKAPKGDVVGKYLVTWGFLTFKT